MSEILTSPSWSRRHVSWICRSPSVIDSSNHLLGLILLCLILTRQSRVVILVKALRSKRIFLLGTRPFLLAVSSLIWRFPRQLLLWYDAAVKYQYFILWRASHKIKMSIHFQKTYKLWQRRVFFIRPIHHSLNALPYYANSFISPYCWSIIVSIKILPILFDILWRNAEKSHSVAVMSEYRRLVFLKFLFND